MAPSTRHPNRGWLGVRSRGGPLGAFRLAFSKCAGWGWDTGSVLFRLGSWDPRLGFYLRTSTKRPACSRFFLGVNAIMLTVLSLVVATR